MTRPQGIPLQECRHGWTYRIHSRNLSFGVFNQETQGFVGIREKFGNRFLFTEFHWDTGEPFGTVTPLEALEACPVQDLREYVRDECSVCHVLVEFVKDDPAQRTGRWEHRGETACQKARPCTVMNQELFEYLDQFKEEGRRWP